MQIDLVENSPRPTSVGTFSDNELGKIVGFFSSLMLCLALNCVLSFWVRF